MCAGAMGFHVASRGAPPRAVQLATGAGEVDEDVPAGLRCALANAHRPLDIGEHRGDRDETVDAKALGKTVLVRVEVQVRSPDVTDRHADLDIDGGEQFVEPVRCAGSIDGGEHRFEVLGDLRIS
jgi:hypothetical protein